MRGHFAVLGGASLVALSLLLAPALAAPSQNGQSRPRLSLGSAGTFTPAVSDPRLAAALSRRGLQSGSFRFTPSAASTDRSRAVRVAVRARANTPAGAQRAAADAPANTSAITAITPSSYNLGASVGWRRFALAGDVAQTEGGIVPGSRESAQVGMSYAANNRVTGRLNVQAERAEGPQRIVGDDSAYSLDVGGSYRLTRGLDLTGGVRYKIARDRLEPLADERRDSQSVYIGTAFRF